MRSSEVLALILSQLIKSIGGTRQRWRRLVGDIRVYSPTTHPHCNWDVDASGSAGEVEAVNRVVDQVRLAHPHVKRD